MLRQVGIQVHAALEPPVPEISYLPVAPHSAGKIFSIFNQEDSQLPRLCDVLATDPLLTAKVLKFVASRHADIPRGSLQYAYLASILGTFQLRSLLIPEALRGFYFPRPQCFWKDCWEHSYFVARLSRQLAIGVDYAYPDEAYIAGLLHNLGVYILMDNGPDKYRDVVQESVSSRREIEEVEEDHFGICHTRIGGVYAEKWGLPRNIVLAIKYHHKVDGSVTNALLNILAAAIGFAHEQGVGTEYLEHGTEQAQQALKKLQLNRKKAQSILEQIPRAVPLQAEP
jgi:HD-like signal output (HDOD) protein